MYDIFLEDCDLFLTNRKKTLRKFDFTFLDPPFNQGKDYHKHNDNMDEDDYWNWMQNICAGIFAHSSSGAAIYFMQREKNTEYVIEVLRKSGWHFQNMIIWKKKTSAVPSNVRFGKSYQIIVFATKGPKPRVFNRMRINPPVLQGYKPRDNGIYVTDVWDDIRELTAGYFAGDEAFRNSYGERLHKQQSPLELLLRMILSSTNPGDCVFDPFFGTGTTLVAGLQLNRYAIGIEKDMRNFKCGKERLEAIRNEDLISQYRKDYICTPNLEDIWPNNPGLDNVIPISITG